MTHEIKENI